MGVRKNQVSLAYGMGDNLLQLAPLPIIAPRAPTTNDLAELGTLWVDRSAGVIYGLARITAGAALWTATPAAGATTLASLIVNPGNATVQAGNLAVTVGNLSIGGTSSLTGAVSTGSTLAVGTNATVGGTLGVTGTTTFTGAVVANNNVTVTGNLQVTGDFDITDTASISLTSTNNAAGAITLLANGGAAETILIRSAQGTGAASLNLLSTAGGVTLTGGLATADAINLVTSAAAGGIDIDAGTAGIAVDTTGAFSIDGAAASNVTVTGAGIDLLVNSVGGSVLVESTEDAALAIRLHANGGTSETIQLHADQGTGVGSINLLSDVGGLTLRSTGLASADAINLEAAAGGVDIDGALQVNIASSQNAADALVLTASAGGIDILATGAAAGEDIDIVATGSSVNVTSTEDAALAVYLRANGGTSETVQIHADQGTGVASVNVLSDVGGITLRATGLASADAINLEAVAGGIDMDSALQTNIASSQAAVANSVRIVASAADGGIDMDSGTGGFTIDSTGAFSIDGAAASNVTTTGAGIDLTLSSVLGSVLVSSTEDAALAIRLHADGGTSETIQIHSDQGTGVASVGLLSDVGGLTLRATGLASADAINLEAAAGGIDVDAALQINIASSQNAADSIVITSSAGGIDILAAGASAGEDIDIVATGSSVNITSTEAVGDAIVLNASNAAGGIDLLAGTGEINLSAAGAVAMVPATASVAGTSLTINARVGVATFTGLTTAAAATETLTITNSALGAGDGIFCTVSNRGTNDAQMTLSRVNSQTAGSLVVQAKNNGAAALNGDLIVTFWIIN